jgi:large subunit ribosomal protein L13
MVKTFAPNPNKIERKWHLIDAEGKVLGKLAADVAVKLIGKDKATYAPNENVGDKVVITNAEKIITTGTKERHKTYTHHTGYPGGLRTEKLRDLRNRRPTEIIKRAINGMLPKNKLRKERLANLYVYEGNKNPHTAQTNTEKK